MGYFSNGTEGEMYMEQYCAKCIHGQDENKGCPVWGLHLMHNYGECNKDDSFLHYLIPRSKDGLGNEQCRMFIERAPLTEADKLYLKWKAAKPHPDDGRAGE